MSTQTTLATVELVERGQPSAATLARLKKAAGQISDSEIISAVQDAEDARANFGAAAVVAGCYLLAKKQTIAHGKWLSWLRTLGDAVTGKCVTRYAFAGEKTVRSCQLYTFLAQHFIADCEQNAVTGEMPDEAPMLPAVMPEEVLHLDTIDTRRRQIVHDALKQFVAGRSMRKLASDLRRADNAARMEEAEEAKPANPGEQGGDSSGDQDSGLPKPPHPLKPEQLKLWEDVARPLHDLDTFIQDRGSLFKKTDRTFWLSVAESLETRLKQAKAALKAIA